MGRFAAAVFFCTAYQHCWGAEPYQEYNKRIESAQTLTALKNDLMGDSVSLYNGVTEFSLSDIEVSGSGLPLRLTRRFSVDLQPMGPGEPLATPKLGGMGNWDIDVPYISGTFDVSNGWRGLNSTGGLTDHRCSVFVVPEMSFSGTMSIFDIWQGNSVHVPGSGDRAMLLADTGVPQPTDGVTRKWTSRERDAFDCIPMVSGISGEGFSMHTTTGMRYDFNVSVSRAAGSMRQSRGPDNGPVTLVRTKIYLLATRVTDRFGNRIDYTYNGNGNPTAIVATDATGEVRRIDLTYSGGRLSTASTNGRTWSYGYDGSGNLSTVTLPDSSSWRYGYSGDLRPPYEFWDGGGTCNEGPDALQASYQFTSTHPSGATATFSFQNLRHYRSGVQKSECIAKVAGSSLYYVLRTPNHFDVMSLVSKQITGPGIREPLVWSYSYTRSGQPLWGAIGQAAPYPCTTCPTIKNTAVVEPDGSKTLYKYGFLYYFNDGQLLGSDTYDAAGTLMSSSTSELMTDAQVAGQPFSPTYGLHAGGDDPGLLRVRPVYRTTIQQDATTYQSTTDSFDSLARPASVTKASPWHSRTDVTEYYDDRTKWILGQPSKVTNSDTGLVVSQISYDGNAMPLQTWAFGKLQQTLTYNANGTVATVADGNNHVTTLGSWKRGTPQAITYADSTGLSAVVDDNGWITSITDELGNTTNYGYDLMGRIASIAYPTGDAVGWNTVTQTFAQVPGVEYGLGAGHWRQVVATGNARKETYFDAMWRPIVTREYDMANVAGTQRFRRFDYDEEGRQAFASYPGSTDALNTGIWTLYDALGRTTSVSQDSELGAPLMTLTQYPGNNQTRVTDPRGNVTVTGYQVFDHPDYSTPAWIQHPEGAYTDISRDVFGKPTAIRRRNADSSLSVTRSYVYDGYQQLCKTVEPETGASATGYDGAGNVVWSAAGLSLTGLGGCDAQAAFDSGRRIDRTYDARNRLKTLAFPDGNGNQSWSYFNDGKPSQVVTNNDGGANQTVNTYTYNKRRLLTAETTGQAGDFNWGLGYGYDANGALANITYPSGLSVNYAPNALGQPTQAGSYAVGVSYYPNGGMQQFTYGNGIVHTMIQNARQLPSQVTDSNGVLSNTYTYDAAGNVKRIDDGLDASRTRAMQYDGLDRLIEADSASFGGDGALKYTYDVLDNIRSAKLSGVKQHNYFYDANNRLTNVQNDAGATTIGLGYDLQGNLSNKSGQGFSFDYGNRLRAATGKEAYRYDAQGRRVVSTDAATGGRILSMYGQDGALRRQANERKGQVYEYIQLNGSLVAKVTTVVAPAVPVLTAPSFSNNGTYTVAWSAVPTATSYELQERKNSDDWAGVYSGAGTSWAASGKVGANYAYRLRACQGATCSGWSALAQVTVSLPPASAPTLSVPGTAYNGTIILSWTSVGGADRYVLEEQAGGGAWQTVLDANQTSAQLVGRATGTYAYRVTAWNAGGPGPVSPVAQTQLINKPTGSPSLTLADPTVGGAISLGWSAVATAVRYQIEESTDGQNWTVLTSDQTGQSIGLSRGNNQRYYYRVSGCNGAGCGRASPPASTQVIIRPAVSPIISLPGSSATGSYTVSWSAVGYATSYQVQERIGTGAWVGLSSTASLSIAISGHTDGSYGYRVQACNLDGCGPWSAEPGINVLLPITGTPTISAPSTVNGLTYTVSWTAVARAARYALKSVAPGGGTVTNNIYALSNDYAQTQPGTWSYQVQGCNDSGCGPWSNQVSVTLIVNPPPAVPTGLTVTQRTAMDCRVSWMPVSGASYYELSEAGFVFSWPASFYTFDGICPKPYKIRACNAQGACSAWSSPK